MGKILTLCAVVAVACTALLTGCNNTGCVDMRSAVPKADFYSFTTGNKLTVDSIMITGIGAPGDSVLYGPGERLSSVFLPMPPTRNTVQWRFAYCSEELAALELADTLTMAFDRSEWFAGEECGAMYNYRITAVTCTRHLIDSVALIDSVVTNMDRPTLNIYFRTAESDESGPDTGGDDDNENGDNAQTV